jgi:hypothetical protein
MVGRWIAGMVITVLLLGAAVFASSSANGKPATPPTLTDDFSLGVIAADNSQR